MKSTFLKAAKQGKSGFKHYVLAIFSMPFLFIGLSIVFMIYLLLSGFPLDQPEQLDLEQLPCNSQAIVYSWLCLGLCCAIFLITAVIHKRHPITLINAEKSIRYKRTILGFTIYLIIRILSSAFLFLLYPQNYALGNSISEALIFLPLSLITFFSVSVFFFVFCAYFLQGINLVNRGVLVVIALSSLFSIVFSSFLTDINIIEIFAPFIVLFFMFFVIAKDNGIELIVGHFMALWFYSSTLVRPITENIDDLFAQCSSLFIAQPPPEFISIPLGLIQIAVFYYLFFIYRLQDRV